MQREYLPSHKCMIERNRVTDLLNEAVSYSVVSIVAPPGYGKTLAVSEFCRQSKQYVIWMHCVKFDNDVRQFWISFTNAVEREFPECAATLKAMGIPGTANAFGDMLRLLHQVFSQKKTVIVFDNLECIYNEELLFLMNTIIEAEVQNLCVIVIANRRISTILALESRQRYHLGASVLEFTREELALLSSRWKLNLSGDDLRKIRECTMGWPYAVHLLFMELKREDNGYFDEGVVQQVLFELFEYNYYKKYTTDIRMMMIMFSFLPYITLNLLRIVGIHIIEETWQVLSENIFINYDPTDQEYKLHRLYRLFLVSKQEILPSDKVTEMLTRAGQWYLDNGQDDHALTCFWSSRDYDHYVRAVLQLKGAWRTAEDACQILENLNEISCRQRSQNALIDYCRAFMYLNNMQAKKARAIFMEVLADNKLSQNDLKITGNAYIAMAHISQLLNTTEGVDYMKRAVKLLPHGDMLRSRELLIVENNEIFFLPVDQPMKLDAMIEYQLQFARLADQLSNGSGAGADLLFAAEACYFSGKFSRALEYAQCALYKAKSERQYDIVCNALYVKMRVCLFLGDVRAASGYMSEIRSYARSYEITALYDIGNCAKGWLYTNIGYIEKVETEIRNIEMNINSPNSRDSGKGRSHIVTAFYYLARRQYNTALGRLIELDEVFEERGLWVSAVYSHLGKALCYIHTGREDAALDELWMAYSRCGINNLWVLFADLGKDMNQLIQAAKKQERYPFDPEWIDKIYTESSACAERKYTMYKMIKAKMPARQVKGITLTDRQKEVLYYLVDGLTQKEIAAKMGITVNGIKKHIASIYTKLGAVNRMDALYIAMTNGLLNEHRAV